MITIGTRDSALAVWQANRVKDLFAQQGLYARLVPVKSDGDLDTTTPLYAIGVEGIFTKALDSSLLNGTIDVAVHSMKDVPIQLASGLLQAAVLERGNHLDVFVPKQDTDFLVDRQSKALIATCSIRRKAQWLRRYPNHTIDSIRGNVDTRLKKVYNSYWEGAIFAAAGLERIGIRPANAVELTWMLPAPAQGAIMVVCRKNDERVKTACANLNHEPTSVCVKVERDFLKGLMGGCSAPISAIAQWRPDGIHFKGNILSADGKQIIEIEDVVSGNAIEHAGLRLAQEMLDKGAERLVRESRGGFNE